jgi:hypothetical protein
LTLAIVLIRGPFPSHADPTLADTLVQRAQSEVVRTKALVENGTLAPNQLKQAEERLADAQDQLTLAKTLYGTVRVQDMTDAEAKAMVEAASQRVDRQRKLVDERRNLVDKGIIARSEMADLEQELQSRNNVLYLARNRVSLLQDLRAMAVEEERFERAAQPKEGAAQPKEMEIRYEGNGQFGLSDLPAIAAQFEKRFNHALPVSAFGQTLVHQSMGLDHRNRVDIALNPDAPEGVWLRSLLERLHIPYLAFRSAVAGAATAPHIHIGTGSARLAAVIRVRSQVSRLR